jgi:hypothetical protein
MEHTRLEGKQLLMKREIMTWKTARTHRLHFSTCWRAILASLLMLAIGSLMTVPASASNRGRGAEGAPVSTTTAPIGTCSGLHSFTKGILLGA